EVGADKRTGGAFDDLNDLAARSESAAAGLAHDADEDLVAAGGIEDVFLRDKDLRSNLAVDGVRPDEAEAAARFAKDAVCGAVWRRLPHRVVLAELHAALLEQCAEHVAEMSVLTTHDPEFSGQGFRLEWSVRAPADRGD